MPLPAPLLIDNAVRKARGKALRRREARRGYSLKIVSTGDKIHLSEGDALPCSERRTLTHVGERTQHRTHERSTPIGRGADTQQAFTP